MVILEFILGMLDFLLNRRTYALVMVSVCLILAFAYVVDNTLAVAVVAVVLLACGFAGGSTWEYHASQAKKHSRLISQVPEKDPGLPV
jgi:Flp pilus assembly protein TadB